MNGGKYTMLTLTKKKKKKKKSRSRISHRADFKAREVIRNKVGDYIMMKGSILQQDKT